MELNLCISAQLTLVDICTIEFTKMKV